MLVGNKAKGKSTAVTLYDCLLLLTPILVYVYIHVRNVEGYFCRGRRCQHGASFKVRRVGDKKTG